MFSKTLPEAQRTQGIEFITQIIFMTKINLMPSYLKDIKGGLQKKLSLLVEF